MSYNSGKYNTRHSGRYNTPGQFVPAGERAACRQLPGTPGGRAAGGPSAPGAAAAQYTPQPQRNAFQSQQQQQQTYTPTPTNNSNSNLTALQSTDVEMKSEPADSKTMPSGAGDSPTRPYWMKSKLAGVKKVSNKEKRRRQNETLRRLLSPKNALMVLNEMIPKEQINNQFKVEPAHQFANNYFNKGGGAHSFCADLTLDGNTYKGYGENKLMARNAAAEQAIRDLIIKKLAKAAETAAATPAAPPTPVTPGANPPAPEEDDNDEEVLPMIQLASFALHKLFSEWEYEGHKVPQLKPVSTSICEMEATAAAGAGAGGGAGGGAGAAPGRRAPPPPPAKKPPKPPKELPLNAAALHPCMLLTYMRPQLEYRELAAEGDRPQNMVFTLGVEVDGATYIGKAANKKEARKQAAKAACQALFGVQFQAAPTASAPQPPQPPPQQPPPQQPQAAA